MKRTPEFSPTKMSPIPKQSRGSTESQSSLNYQDNDDVFNFSLLCNDVPQLSPDAVVEKTVQVDHQQSITLCLPCPTSPFQSAPFVPVPSTSQNYALPGTEPVDDTKTMPMTKSNRKTNPQSNLKEDGTQWPSTVTYLGWAYTIIKGGEFSANYRCSRWRQFHCNAYYAVRDTPGRKQAIVTLTNEHTHAQQGKAAQAKKEVILDTGMPVNIEVEMKEFVASDIYNYVGKAPYEAATMIMTYFEEKYAGQATRSLTVGQLKNLVISHRTGEAKGDFKLQIPPMSTVSISDPKLFLQFDVKINLTAQGTDFSRLTGWAHPGTCTFS